MVSIAMEYCKGGSLDSVCREVKKLGGCIGEKLFGKVAESVLQGLTYLHQLKIIHRGISMASFIFTLADFYSDIKPPNILFTRDGQVKICDFGVSGEFGTRGDANTMIGTSYYMSPERIIGQPYTINSDVWSLGVTMLEAAQRRFPFFEVVNIPRAGLINLLALIVQGPIPKLQDEPQEGIKWSDNFKFFIECW
jgi:mitogen-activated protein kinase kinase